MAYTAANLSLISSVNGFGLYRYDTTDELGDVDDGGYFNNTDDNLNLAKGDLIHVIVWVTAVRTGTISLYQLRVVPSIPASNGAVNTAEVGVYTAGALSST